MLRNALSTGKVFPSSIANRWAGYALNFQIAHDILQSPSIPHQIRATPAPPPPAADPGGDGPGVWTRAYHRGREELFDLIAEFRRADAKKKRKIVRKAVVEAIAEEALLPPELRPFARVPLPQVTKATQIDVAALVKDMTAVKALLDAARRQAEEDDDEDAIWLLMH